MTLAVEKWETTSEWVRTSELASRLRITSTTLLRWRAKYTKDGIWQEGSHWIRTGEVGNSHILFNVQEVFKTFASMKAPVRD